MEKEKIKTELLEKLDGVNFIYGPGNSDQYPVLRGFVSDGELDFSIGTPPGDRYEEQDNEFHYDLGAIDPAGLNYEIVYDPEKDGDPDDYWESDAAFEDQVNGDNLLEMLDIWVEDITNIVDFWNENKRFPKVYGPGEIVFD